jgi:flagellar hook-length control protein FliK
MQLSNNLGALQSLAQPGMDRSGVSGNKKTTEEMASFEQLLGDGSDDTSAQQLATALASLSLDEQGATSDPDLEGDQLHQDGEAILAALRQIKAELSKGSEIRNASASALKNQLDPQMKGVDESHSEIKSALPQQEQSALLAEHLRRLRSENGGQVKAEIETKSQLEGKPDMRLERLDFFQRSVAQQSRDTKEGMPSELLSREVSGKQTKAALPQPSSVDEFAKQLLVQRDLGLTNSLRSGLGEAEMTSNSQPRLMQQNLFEDMRSHVARMVQTDQGGKMTLQLRPGNLGRVEIDVHVEAKTVRIEMRADEQRGEQALRGQLAELRTQLQNAGLKVDELNLQNVRSTQDPDDANQARQDQDGNRQFAREKNERESSQEETPSEDAMSFEEHLVA